MNNNPHLEHHHSTDDDDNDNENLFADSVPTDLEFEDLLWDDPSSVQTFGIDDSESDDHNAADSDPFRQHLQQQQLRQQQQQQQQQPSLEPQQPQQSQHQFVAQEMQRLLQQQQQEQAPAAAPKEQAPILNSTNPPETPSPVTNTTTTTPSTPSTTPTTPIKIAPTIPTTIQSTTTTITSTTNSHSSSSFRHTKKTPIPQSQSTPFLTASLTTTPTTTTTTNMTTRPSPPRPLMHSSSSSASRLQSSSQPPLVLAALQRQAAAAQQQQQQQSLQFRGRLQHHHRRASSRLQDALVQEVEDETNADDDDDDIDNDMLFSPPMIHHPETSTATTTTTTLQPPPLPQSSSLEQQTNDDTLPPPPFSFPRPPLGVLQRETSGGLPENYSDDDDKLSELDDPTAHTDAEAAAANLPPLSRMVSEEGYDLALQIHHQRRRQQSAVSRMSTLSSYSSIVSMASSSTTAVAAGMTSSTTAAVGHTNQNNHHKNGSLYSSTSTSTSTGTNTNNNSSNNNNNMLNPLVVGIPHHHHHHPHNQQHHHPQPRRRSSSFQRSLISSFSSSATNSLHSSSMHSHRSRSITLVGRQRLEEMTIDKLRFNDVGLVGRNPQVQQLQQLFEQTFAVTTKLHSDTTNLLQFAQQSSNQSLSSSSHHGRGFLPPNGRSLVLIEGAAGTGKSRLAHHVLEPLVQKYGGLFLVGKHDLQQGADRPYAGIAACCDALCEQIFGLWTSEQQEFLQRQLLKILGPERAVLTSILPSLTGILGEIEQQQQQGDNNDNNTTTTPNKNNGSNHSLQSALTKAASTSHHGGGGGFAMHSDGSISIALEAASTHFTSPTATPPPPTLHTSSNHSGSGGPPPPSLPTNASFYATRRNSSGGGYMEANLRFNNAFRRFVRVVCSMASCVVLLIDDLQWCDEPSFQLLEHVLKDSSNRGGILVVGTLRPEEIDRPLGQPQHPLVRFRERARLLAETHDRIRVQNIPIGDLTVEATLDLLVELLSADPDQALPLAKCVQSKTNGNAFFTVQFLTSLQQRRLLEFNYGSLSWTWNVDQINESTVATENVADLVRGKLEILPVELTNILPLLGSLGSVFRLDLFEMLMHHVRRNGNSKSNNSTNNRNAYGSEDGKTNHHNHHNNHHHPLGLQEQPTVESDVVEVLNTCMDVGLIEPYGKDSFRWIHDKVEEAALTMVPRDRLEGMQFELAASLLEQMDEAQVKENVFVLVYLFRTSHKRLSPNDAKRNTIAKLKLESGLQAFQASAFLQAAKELKTGIELLSENSWAIDYDLCLKLYSTAAEANLCIGELETAEKYVAEILIEARTKPLLDKRRAYNVLVRSYMANGRAEKASSTLLSVLVKLGVTFGGKRTAVFNTVTKLVKVRKNAKMIAGALSKQPAVPDTAKAWSVFLLDRLWTCWYQMNNPMMALAVLKALDVILDVGICEITPNIVASLGLLCSTVLQDHEAGRIYSVQALDLLNKMDSKYCEAQTCFVVHHFTLRHTTPVEELKKGLFRGYHSGMANGDSEFACWCISAFLEHSFITGAVLESLARRCRVHAPEAMELKQMSSAHMIMLVWQTTQNLGGYTRDPLILTGEAMDEKTWLRESGMERHWRLQLVKYQVIVAVLLGEYERAIKLVLEHKIDRKSYDEAFPGSFTTLYLHFHSAIAALSMARGPKRSRFYRGIAKKFAQQLESWSEVGSPNVKHYAALVSAELADMKDDVGKANELYQRSILLSARRGFRQDRALAHERYGQFYLRRRDVSSAKHHLVQALSLYQEWGGVTKVKRLQKQFPRLLQPQPSTKSFAREVTSI